LFIVGLIKKKIVAFVCRQGCVRS